MSTSAAVARAAKFGTASARSPLPVPAPLTDPVRLRKIAADRFVYAVHSVWPPSIHKKAKRALRDARRRGVALRRPAPAPDASAECASERNGRFVGA